MLPFEWNYKRIVRKVYPKADIVYCLSGIKISENGTITGLKLSFAYPTPKQAWKEIATILNNRPKMNGPLGFQLLGV